jgi:hypothetical protein
MALITALIIAETGVIFLGAENRNIPPVWEGEGHAYSTSLA